MKKTILFLFTVLAFASCSIYQELTFHENGSVSYAMTIDADEFIKYGQDFQSSEYTTSDTTMWLKDIISEKINIEDLSEEKKYALESLAPMMIKVSQDAEKQELTIAMTGDFKNVEELNRALNILSSVDENKNPENNDAEGTGNADYFSKFFTAYNSYEWDGKKMSATGISPKKEISEEDEEEDINMFFHMFSGGRARVIYTFPKKIASVSNKDALFSLDGKSAILEYSALEFMTTPQLTDIQIELED